MCGIYVSQVTPIPVIADINESTMGISLSVLVGIGIYEFVQYRREKEKEKSCRTTQAAFGVGKDDQISIERKNQSAFGRIRQPFRSFRRKRFWNSGVRPEEQQQQMDEAGIDLPPPYTPTEDIRGGRLSGHLAWAKL